MNFLVICVSSQIIHLSVHYSTSISFLNLSSASALYPPSVWNAVFYLDQIEI